MPSREYFIKLNAMFIIFGNSHTFVLVGTLVPSVDQMQKVYSWVTLSTLMDHTLSEKATIERLCDTYYLTNHQVKHQI